MTSTNNPRLWAKLLRDYCARNAGRRARLESDDPEVGPQWAEIDFPLRGITYDGREDRIEILLGESSGFESRLTHSIEAPWSLDVPEAASSQGDVLRISHGNRQTRVRFVGGPDTPHPNRSGS